MEYSHPEPFFPVSVFGQRLPNNFTDEYYSRDAGIELNRDEDMELESETNLQAIIGGDSGLFQSNFQR